MSEPTQADPLTQAEPLAEGDDVQVAFDVGELPGGARAAIAAVLMIVEEPVTDHALASALELPVEEIREHLGALESTYADGQHGFTVRNVGGGWRFYSHHAYAPVVERFVIDGQQSKLTTASLETLAVIAYRQPIARGRISAIRGVTVDGVVRTLLTRGLIVEVTKDEESNATLYGTTPYFLERMGLNSLDDLPPIAPYLPDATVLDELMNEARP
ncbi:segregation and condensation protein B [Janibacter sp. Soil728]|uniref:SMC-Scp complex subunit ScpB n=1 Tax=Janibacter sp. Soil728 TaxID=1736393 RepID=UPI0007023128|nr:SMC-Scp complex subunit ScpB [Janibacter sp. Soil728]KRE37050.1 segregation and condensation protein B [Janibacter sp. Soil728]